MVVTTTERTEDGTVIEARPIHPDQLLDAHRVTLRIFPIALRRELLALLRFAVVIPAIHRGWIGTATG
jgi:hypothetical protein